MIKEFKINTEPTQFNLEKIERWLIEEDKEFKEGFYCNWNKIERAFNNKKLITFDFKEMPIGFLVWSKSEIYIEIEILEIKREHRRKGIGQVFFENSMDYFKSKDFLVIKLICSPRESEKFWIKMGFLKFPDRGYGESELTYFKTLIDTQAISKNVQTNNKIELWDVEPYQIRNNSPKWTWFFEAKNDKLVYPIIHPCNNNWNLRWTKDGIVIKERKVKYFGVNENLVEYSPFLYIKELIE